MQEGRELRGRGSGWGISDGKFSPPYPSDHWSVAGRVTNSARKLYSSILFVKGVTVWFNVGKTFRKTLTYTNKE